MDNNRPKSFSSPKRFFDSKHFPHGFARSGDFTRTQAQTLESIGIALKALAEGSRDPMTNEEEKFVDFCRHQLAPSTDIERAWFAYCKALERKNISFTASSGAMTSSSDPISTEVSA